MQHENILKVVDIPIGELSKEMTEFLQRQLPVYCDQIMEEHLYSVEDIEENEPPNNPYPEPVQDQLTQINSLMRNLDCGYFRIVKS